MDQASAYKTELKTCLEHFGANIRRLRTTRERRISQEELSFVTNLHRTEIGALEQGRVEPRLSTLLILADGLSVTLDELVAGVPVPVERRPGPKPRPRPDSRQNPPAGYLAGRHDPIRIRWLRMLKLLYKPFGIVSGIVAGLLGRRLFARLWAVADSEDPPKPENRVSWPKLLGALALEGAVFRLAKGAMDHASRRWFATLTGKWPGEERPKVKD